MLIAPLLLAAVLAFSGVAKVARVDATLAAMRSLRLPQSRCVAAALPWAEIALAVLLLLLPAGWAVIPAGGALTLMLMYLGIVTRAWRIAPGADCACFGDAAPSAVTWRAVVRNVVFVGVAAWSVFVALHHGLLSAVINLGDDWPWLLGALAVGAVTYFTFADSRSDELEDYLRAPIPFGELTTLDGETVTLRDLARTRGRLMIFVSPTCGACQPIHDQIDEWMAALPQLSLHLVYSSASSASRVTCSPRVADNLLIDDGQRVARLFDHAGAPWAVLLATDQLLAGGPVAGTQAVVDFVADIHAELAKAQA